MNKINDLGSRSDRNTVFSRELLAEADDEKLKMIVEEAARDLNTPIALVTLVMEHVQFFKAHYGLPQDLAAMRGTDRDISFCQFVVATGESFEVENALTDDRVPKELVEQYDIRAYMGMPVTINDTVVRSLCELDTKPRKFTETERNDLRKLSMLVNGRLSALASRRNQSNAMLLEHAAFPALVELRGLLKPIRSGIDVGHATILELSTFLRIAERSLYGRTFSKEEMLKILSRAKEALDKYQNGLYDITVSVDDAEDSIDALEHVFHSSTTTLLSEIAISGRELARHSTVQSGGVLLPEIEEDIFVSTPRPFGVSLLAMTLSMFASRMVNSGLREKIRITMESGDSNAALVLEARGMPEAELLEIVKELKTHTDEDPTVSVRMEDGRVMLLFSVVKTRQ